VLQASMPDGASVAQLVAPLLRCARGSSTCSVIHSALDRALVAEMLARKLPVGMWQDALLLALAALSEDSTGGRGTPLRMLLDMPAAGQLSAEARQRQLANVLGNAIKVCICLGLVSGSSADPVHVCMICLHVHWQR
jgi:hypothetical protein